MVKLADQKISVLLIISSAMTTFIFSNFKEIKVEKIFYQLPLIFYILSSLGFLVFGLFVIFTRKASISDYNVPMLIYFEHLSRFKKLSEFYNNFKELNSNDIIKDITSPVFEVSQIASKKYKNYNFAWIVLVFQILLFFELS